MKDPGPSTWSEVPFTANRRVIYDLLDRARRYHAPVTGNMEVDLTDTDLRVRREREEGREVSLIAALIRATAVTVARHPVLRHHLFTTWYGRPREVVFDRIDATVIVAREGPSGEEVLLPLTLRGADRLSIAEIHAILRDHKRKAPEELPQFRAMERVKRAPPGALRWFSYKARSDPDFYAKHFGTYGVSSLLDRDGAVSSVSTVANTAIAFLPNTLRERAWVVDGKIVPRLILGIAGVFDHYLVDGNEAARVGRTLRGLLEDPDALFTPPGGSRG